MTITENGTRVLYTPTTDYTGSDSFTYTIRDPGGLEATAATANITVQQFDPARSPASSIWTPTTTVFAWAKKWRSSA